MCERPLTLEDGTQVRCRECWQCRAQIVDDIVGRCIAEKRTSVGSHAIGLTYGRERDPLSRDYGSADHPRAAFLTYSDPQKLFKLLRFHGYPFRYFIAGEMGSLKGRAHWHCVFFWKERIPPIELQKRTIWMRDEENAWWPHGTYWAERPEYEHFRYNCKYVLKDQKQEGKRSHTGRSRNPPLGFQYFMQLARKQVSEYLAPQDLKYNFPEAVRKNGKRVEFTLRGRMAELYLQAWVTAWSIVHPTREPPPSELIEKYLSSEDNLLHLEPYRKRVASPMDWEEDFLTGVRHPVGIKSLIKRFGFTIEKTDTKGIWDIFEYRHEGRPVEFYRSGPFNVWCYDAPDGRHLTWQITEEGKMEWRDVALESAVSRNKRAWDLAVIAARQSGRSSPIRTGTRPGKIHPAKRQSS